MPTQENSIVADAVSTGHGTNPPLVEVTSQLLPEGTSPKPVVATEPPKKPQVVFVEQRRKTHVIEIHVEPKTLAELKANMELPGGEVEENAASTPFVAPYSTPADGSEGRFAVDPFVYEIDGPIPVMPTLPIVESRTSTDEVVAREKSGEHFAWRLMPGPYPAEGNVPQVPVDEIVDPEQAVLNKPQSLAGEHWTETEVVAENDHCDHGDCFYAQSGDVIAIDGNRGFDHIDLRSYSIEDATFQQGAILLHANLEIDEAGEGEQLPQPITIRHRGVEFAVFKGEVRVEL